MKSILEIAKILGCIAQINEYNQLVRNTNAKLGISVATSPSVKSNWRNAINRLNAVIKGCKFVADNSIHNDCEVVFGVNNVRVSAGNGIIFNLDDTYVLSEKPLTLFDVFNKGEIRERLAQLPPYDIYQLTINRELIRELNKSKLQYERDLHFEIKAILKSYGFYYDSASGKVSNELMNYSLFIDGGQQLEYFKLDLPCLFLKSFSGCLLDAIRVFGSGTRNAIPLNEVLIIKNN